MDSIQQEFDDIPRRRRRIPAGSSPTNETHAPLPSSTSAPSSAAADLEGTRATQETHNTNPAAQRQPIAALPVLAEDYAKIWADHWISEGGDPAEEAANLDCYGKAVDAVDRGELTIQGVNGNKLAEAIRDFAAREFRRHIRMRQRDNIYHTALMGFLYRAAVERLRTDGLGSFPPNPLAAEQIENYVDRMFVDEHFAKK